MYVTGATLVTANNHTNFTIQIQGRLRDYLRLLMDHPVCRILILQIIKIKDTFFSKYERGEQSSGNTGLDKG